MKMAAPGSAPIAVELEGISGSGTADTNALLRAMLRTSERVSDLIFSPGRPPQVEVHGQLLAAQASGLHSLTAHDTPRIAAQLIGNNKQAIASPQEQGSFAISYGLPAPPR